MGLSLVLEFFGHLDFELSLVPEFFGHLDFELSLVPEFLGHLDFELSLVPEFFGHLDCELDVVLDFGTLVFGHLGAGALDGIYVVDSKSELPYMSVAARYAC